MILQGNKNSTMKIIRDKEGFLCKGSLKNSIPFTWREKKKKKRLEKEQAFNKVHIMGNKIVVSQKIMSLLFTCSERQANFSETKK